MVNSKKVLTFVTKLITNQNQKPMKRFIAFLFVGLFSLTIAAHSSTTVKTTTATQFELPTQSSTLTPLAITPDPILAVCTFATYRDISTPTLSIFDRSTAFKDYRTLRSDRHTVFASIGTNTRSITGIGNHNRQYKEPNRSITASTLNTNTKEQRSYNSVTIEDAPALELTK